MFMACNSEEKPLNNVKPGNMENLFFELDLTDPDVSLDRVKQYFFTTYPHEDPTEGEVIYDRTKWEHDRIVQFEQGKGLFLYIRARESDHFYDSFRLTSKPYYNLNQDTDKILFVFRGKLPSGKGIWPAWWLNGSREDQWLYTYYREMPTEEDVDSFSGKGRFYETPSPVNSTDWPAAGEIDIIETINGDNLVYNTLHTCPNMCNSIWNSDGVLINCANASPADPNHGCSGKPYQMDTPEGTFACIWEHDRLRFYYWPPEVNVREEGGPLSPNPDPESWEDTYLKNEALLLESDVECEDHVHRDWQCKTCAESNTCDFVNMKMIFNATICGKWAGSHFDETGKAWSNCREYISSEGRSHIDNQFMLMEYVAVKKLD